jgi:hypothetical protein
LRRDSDARKIKRQRRRFVECDIGSKFDVRQVQDRRFVIASAETGRAGPVRRKGTVRTLGLERFEALDIIEHAGSQAGRRVFAIQECENGSEPDR